MKKCIILLVMMAIPCLTLHAQPTDISGDYAVRGTNPNGTRYKGTCSVSKLSGNTYRFTWSVGNSYSGTGKLVGNKISVNWGDKFPVIYKVMPGGRLVGTWAGGRATEILLIEGGGDEFEGPIEDL